MNSVKVNSLPLKEVISDLAKAFNTEYSEICDEFILHVPPDIGSGFIKGINFDSGLGIIHYDCTFKEDLEIKFVVNEIHPLKFLYCTEGILTHRFGNTDKLHDIERFKKAIVASKSTIGHVLCFKANTRVVVFSLEIARQLFSQINACEMKSMEATLKSLFSDVDAETEFYHDGFYSVNLAQSFQEIESFEEGNFLRKFFLQGKAYELLTEQIVEYLDDLEHSDKRRILRKSEVKSIADAASILKEEVAKSNTIEAIAKRVGLNPNKLQMGFQLLYNSTINQFVHNYRLQLAKELVLDTDLSMSEIVTMLGLTSKSYFSKIFKEKYGITPSKYRAQITERLKKLGENKK